MATQYEDFYVIRATPAQLRHLRHCVHRTLYLDRKGAKKLHDRYGEKLTNKNIFDKIDLGEDVLKILEEN